MSESVPVGVFATWKEAPLPVKAILVGTFVNRLGGFLQVFLVLFLTKLGYSSVQAGFTLGAYGVGSVVGVLLGGSISDRIGPRRTVIGGMLAGAACLLAILYVQAYPVIVVLVVLVGAFTQAYRPASAAILAQLTPPHRQVMIFAMSRLALNLGTTAAPLIGAALVVVSYDLLFWGEAIALLGYALLMYRLIPPDRIGIRRKKCHRRLGAARLDRRQVPNDDSCKHSRVQKPRSRGRSSGYLALVRDRRYLLYLFAVLVNSAVYIQYVSILPVAMRADGAHDFWYSVIIAINGLVVICFELPMTTIVSQWPARRVLAVGFPLLGAGVACYALPWGLAAFVVGTLIWSLAEIIQGPTMFAYFAQAGPEHLRGRYLAAGHGLFGVGTAIGPPLGLLLWSHLGSAVWILYGLASVAALVPAWYGIRPERARVDA